MAPSINRPSWLWLITEPTRALFELGLSYPFNSLNKINEKGNGHPVMVLPGFMGSEKSTVILRNFIKKLGYDAYDWGLGRNLGKVEYTSLLIERIDEISQQTGMKVSLVGWSLGGVFARQVAKERPELIQQVITLGSPFAGLTEPNNASWMYSIITGGRKVKNINAEFLQDLPTPAPVPTTAIYSKEDGIVPWEVCMEKNEDNLHQNIQVHGSHIGLAMNPSVLSIIEDRLKLSTDNWTKFKTNGFLGTKIVYPSL